MQSNQNIIDVTPQASAVTAPFKVDPSKGTSNSRVSSQWFARPDDQRFLNLVEQAASPLDPHLRNTGLDAIVREIVSSRKKTGAG